MQRDTTGDRWPQARQQAAIFRFSTPRYSLEATGVHRRLFASNWNGDEIAAAFRAGLDEAMRAGHSHPLVVGALPFHGSEPAHLYVPKDVRWSSARSPAQEAVHTAEMPRIRVQGEDSPAYRATVAKALRRIAIGMVDKVVLARRIRVEAEQPFDVAEIFTRLCQLNRSAFIFQLDLPSSKTEASPVLLGASPELVLSSDNGRVQSAPLAGSIPRGPDPDTDRELGAGLLRSQKDLHEHALVVRAVGEQFRRHCDDVVVPSRPELVQTPVIWHLGSRISGMLRAGIHPVQLAYALHPTPAVGGWPRQAAQRVISGLEDFERGFYAGLVGWMDADGNGEWALTLRCGIIDGNQAQVFAGAGIVAKSDPEKEHTETATKLRTFLGALGRIDDHVAVSAA